MLLGPIFQVELVAAARQGRQYLVRVIYALIILFVLWVSYSSMSQWQSLGAGGGNPSISDIAQMATTFFVAFSWVQLLGILAIAPAMAVGTIASERERRTIEYLFATDLSNFEIVVGKTFARLLIVGQLVLVSLPILFIFRLLGGISADLLAGSFITAASTALVLTSLSVCVSVWSPRSRDAVMRVYRLLAVLLIVPGVLSAMLMVFQLQLQRRSELIEAAQTALRFILSLNPVAVLSQSMLSVFAAGAGFDFEPVLKMAAWHVGLSVALIWLATYAVRRVHLRDASRGDVKQQKGESRRGMEKLRWRPELSDNAMLWKEAFAPTAKTKLGILGSFANAVIVIIALGLTAYFFICAKFEILDFDADAYYIFMAMTTGFLGSGLLLTMAGRSAGLITLEKERDCWISLLSTPLSGGEIVRAKLLGNLYSARWGFALLMVVWLLAATFDIRFLLMLPPLALSFTLTALFVSQVGLHYSLVSSTSLRAMGYTLATVFFFGGGYLFCCCSVAAIGSRGDPPETLMALGMAPCMPFLLVAPIAYSIGDMNLRGEYEFAIAYGAGIIGYAVVNALLAYDLANSFDRRAGRTIGQREAVMGGIA